MKFNKEKMLKYFQNSCTPEKLWRIGFESERFAILIDSGKSVPYNNNKVSIKNFLIELVNNYNFSPVYENNELLGANNEFSDITLEPGSQFEVALKPFFNYKELITKFIELNNILYDISLKYGFKWVASGVQPFIKAEEIELIPKKRYEIMNNYFNEKGGIGYQMMRATTSIQVSLDYKNEEHFSKMFRTIFGISPIMVAWFANSAVCKDIKNNYINKRSLIWRHTDKERCGLIKGVLSGNFGFSDYIDYFMNVPMMLKYNENKTELESANGMIFKDYFNKNKINEKDFQLHLTEIFTIARLKNYVEVRCCDSLPLKYLFSLPAFWCGLLYNDKSLEKIDELLGNVNEEELLRALDDSSHNGFKAKYLGKTILELAEIIYNISLEGLKELKYPENFNKDFAIKCMGSIKGLLDNKMSLSDEMIKENLNSDNISEICKMRELDKYFIVE